MITGPLILTKFIVSSFFPFFNHADRPAELASANMTAAALLDDTTKAGATYANENDEAYAYDLRLKQTEATELSTRKNILCFNSDVATFKTYQEVQDHIQHMITGLHMTDTAGANLRDEYQAMVKEELWDTTGPGSKGRPADKRVYITSDNLTSETFSCANLRSAIEFGWTEQVNFLIRVKKCVCGDGAPPPGKESDSRRRRSEVSFVRGSYWVINYAITEEQQNDVFGDGAKNDIVEVNAVDTTCHLKVVEVPSEKLQDYISKVGEINGLALSPARRESLENRIERLKKFCGNGKDDDNYMVEMYGKNDYYRWPAEGTSHHRRRNRNMCDHKLEMTCKINKRWTSNPHDQTDSSVYVVQTKCPCTLESNGYSQLETMQDAETHLQNDFGIQRKNVEYHDRVYPRVKGGVDGVLTLMGIVLPNELNERGKAEVRETMDMFDRAAEKGTPLVTTMLSFAHFKEFSLPKADVVSLTISRDDSRSLDGSRPEPQLYIKMSIYNLESGIIWGIKNFKGHTNETGKRDGEEDRAEWTARMKDRTE